MKDLPKNYLRLFSTVISYIKNLVDMALVENKKIIIWGYGRGGRWLQHLVEDYDGRIRIEVIVDNGLPSFISSPNINRSTIFSYLENDKYIVLSTIKNYDDVSTYLEKYGYEDKINCYDVYSKIGDSYISFLEKNYERVYFSEITESVGNNLAHMPLVHSCADMIFEEMKLLGDNLHFFDFGCGLGSAIVQAYAHEVGELIGGVDINNRLVEKATCNLNELDINCDLRCEDATITNIDDYNLFFFYNPFRGRVFDQVIKNIYNSYSRNKREIFIVYGNPFEHEIVMKYMFILYKQIRVDLYIPHLNIYRLGE